MTDNSKKRDAGGRPRAAVPHRDTRPARAAAVTAAALAAFLAGCSTTTTSAPAQPATARLVRLPGSAEPSIELTQLGAQRIGLETASVAAAPGGESTFPYTALVYEPNGQAAVYVASGTLTFTRAFVTVDTITGDVATVKSGVAPGQRVATDGAEELLGLQNGVGEET